MALVGPTASGKSALALEMARRFGAEIVSVDSMQVYRGMDIGTAKPTPEQRSEVRHHLIDLADPGEDYSVARYQAEGTRALADLSRRGRRVILVGGTGLYLRALVDGLSLPGQWPSLRAELEEEVDRQGLDRLFDRLTRMDPLAASRIEPGNRRRLVRALEVCLGSGRPFSSFGPGLASYPPTRTLLLGVDLPRPELDRRICLRYGAQMAGGFLEEVEQLAARPGGLSRTARQALGYRELLDHLERGTPLETALEQAIGRTRRFARRQLAWFRRDPRVRWVEGGPNCGSTVSGVLGECWR